MGSVEVIPPPPLKLKRVYHLTSAEFALSDIALGRLKVARFSDLNDPFELLAISFKKKHVRNAVRFFKRQFDTHTGMLCFSEDWTNPVLWSHYAAKHRGICLGFNLLREYAQSVEYEDKRLGEELEENDEPVELDKDLQKKLIRTKFRHWQYEREVRMLVPLRSAVQEGKLTFLSVQ